MDLECSPEERTLRLGRDCAVWQVYHKSHGVSRRWLWWLPTSRLGKQAGLPRRSAELTTKPGNPATLRLRPSTSLRTSSGQAWEPPLLGKQPYISDEFLPGLTEMTEAVHKAGGMIVMQLAHAGLRPSSRSPNDWGGRTPLCQPGGAAGPPAAGVRGRLKSFQVKFANIYHYKAHLRQELEGD
jgi:hypothetical protein